MSCRSATAASGSDCGAGATSNCAAPQVHSGDSPQSRHSSKPGAGAGAEPDRATTATASTPAIRLMRRWRRHMAAQLREVAASAAAAVVQASRWRRLTNCRNSARATASSSSTDCDSNCTNCQATRPAARSSTLTAWRNSGRSASRSSPGTKAAAAPIIGPAPRAPSTSAMATVGVGQPLTLLDNSKATQAGGTSERRRLSSIFHRFSGVTDQRRGWAMKGSSCQSPRVQRCRRESATSGCTGAPSRRATSPTEAQRSSAPSNRSWLSTWPCGRRPPSTACAACTCSRPLPLKLPSPKRSS